MSSESASSFAPAPNALTEGPVARSLLMFALPILIGYVFGRRVLKLHPVLLLGAITESMTSGAALSVVTRAAKSPVPALGYSSAYAFANVILTLAGSLILLF